MKGIAERIRAWDGAGVVCRYDRQTDSWIFISLHDGTLGPFTGGTRMNCYASLGEALEDGQRLAAGMTAKWAALGMPYGGGKAVLAVPGPLEGEAREGLLRRYGRLIELLGGRFRTGEDLGTTPDDMCVLAEETEYVHGYDRETGKKVDPSPYTALGVWSGIVAGCGEVFGSDDLASRTVLVEGLGHVGWRLAELLRESGAGLLVADIDSARSERAAREFDATVVEPRQVPSTECDVYAPSAIGATVNRDTIPRLACRLVAGSANNQLGEAADADRLVERGIAYAPDYVINGGGAMSFGLMSTGEKNPEVLRGRVETIGETVRELLREAAGRGESPVAAADRRVERVLAAAAAESGR
ncbi:MAG: Glu/Leu/Phe/Val dehydrogenase dimerization domain-containing protein [Thermoanaerobaculia bacterium]